MQKQNEKPFTSGKKFRMNTANIAAKGSKLSAQMPTELPNEVVESQTKKIPNLIFLGVAGAAVAASAALSLKAKDKSLANFIGLWAPTILILGLYNKLVKVEDEVLVAAEEIKDLH